MIAFAYTGSDPGTMMIMHFDASLAITTVERSWRFVHIASSANSNLNFNALHDCHTLFIDLLVTRSLELMLT